MKLYLKISFGCGLLFVLYGAYILASGDHTLYDDNGNIVYTKSYLPFFKLAISTFVFCFLLKVFITYTENRKKARV